MGFPVVKINWTEHERGWGQRSDGCSLHVDTKTAERYVKDYWARQPLEAPDEYSSEGQPEVIDVNEDVFKQIKAAGGSLRLWQHDVRNMKL